MADAQIEILLKIQDELSASLRGIQGELGKFGKTATSQVEKLISVGNAAATVDNIFSSLTNMQIRLENSTERLANSQDRLADTQKGVQRATERVNELQSEYNRVTTKGGEKTQYGIEIIKEYKKRQEELADAKTQEERATRGLTISENNLKRVQNQVIGTYINIGIQSLTLTQSLPILAKSFGLVNKQLTITQLLLSPMILIIAAVAAAFALIFFAIKSNPELLAQFNALWIKLKEAFMQIWVALQPLMPLLKDMFVIIGTVGIAVLTALVGIINDWIVPLFKMWIDDMVMAIGFVGALVDLIKQLVEWLGKVSFSAFEKIRDFFVGGKNKGGGGGGGGGKGKVGDVIMRPDGSVIRTDPRDTLVAMRNEGASLGGLKGGGGGITIYIDKVVGLSAEDVSRALKKELWSKMSI